MVASTSSSCMVAAGRAHDGFLYRVEDNMAASTYSLNKLHPDRGPGSSHSPGSTLSIPLYLMPRPNSVAGKMINVWVRRVHVLIKWLQCSPTCLLLLGRKYIFLNYSDFSCDSEQTKPCFHDNYPGFKTGPLTNRAIHSLAHQWPHFTIINNKIPNNYCLSGAYFYSLFHVCRSE